MRVFECSVGGLEFHHFLVTSKPPGFDFIGLLIYKGKDTDELRLMLNILRLITIKRLRMKEAIGSLPCLIIITPEDQSIFWGCLF